MLLIPEVTSIGISIMGRFKGEVYEIGPLVKISKKMQELSLSLL